MAYAVEIKSSARKQLAKLEASPRRRISDAIDALANNPRPPGVVKMQGDENLWRIRVGSYRIVYEIHDRQLIVLVLRIGDRKDIYR